MRIGIPRGLLYPRYHVFARRFLEEMGLDVVVSPDTNRAVLDEGVRCCVDDACLPVKVFHGHVAVLRDRCDAILVPRVVGLAPRESICPMFCGLIEMLKNGIPGLPDLIDTPVRSVDPGALFVWARKTGRAVSKDGARVSGAFSRAQREQQAFRPGWDQQGYPLKVALIGHTYNINDPFVNMDLIRKLNRLGIGVVTEEHVEDGHVDREAGRLFKKPFWSFVRRYYGAAAFLCRERLVQGLIYVSSFCCGIDSVATELVREEAEGIPFMLLKLDEHTGEAGFDTRLEAFADMLERRTGIDSHDSAYGEHRRRGQSAV